MAQYSATANKIFIIFLAIPLGAFGIYSSIDFIADIFSQRTEREDLAAILAEQLGDDTTVKREAVAKNLSAGRVANLLWTDNNCSEEGTENSILLSILPTILPAAVDLGLDLLANHLSTDKALYSVTNVSQNAGIWANFEFTANSEPTNSGENHTLPYTLTDLRQCLIYFSGNGGKWGDDTDGTKPMQTAAIEKAFYPEEVALLARRPALFMSVDIIYQSLGSKGYAYRLVPYKFSINKNTSKGGGKKDILALVNISVPTIIANGGYNADIPIPPIQRVEIGDRLIFSGSSSKWYPLPTVSSQKEEIIGLPAAVKFTLIETDTGVGAKVYESFSTLIQNKKAALSSAISTALLEKTKN